MFIHGSTTRLYWTKLTCWNSNTKWRAWLNSDRTAARWRQSSQKTKSPQGRDLIFLWIFNEQWYIINNTNMGGMVAQWLAVLLHDKMVKMLWLLFACFLNCCVHPGALSTCFPLLPVIAAIVRLICCHYWIIFWTFVIYKTAISTSQSPRWRLQIPCVVWQTVQNTKIFNFTNT